MIDIKSYLNQFSDYDIRISKDARYVDQKCTPDIVAFIADCIISTSCCKKAFTCNDLWGEKYFINNCVVIFHKPSPTDETAKNEYNKVLAQPLKLLAYAHILDVSIINNTLSFKVANKDILEYIATKEHNAYNFLLIFFTKVLEDSGIMRFFDEYKKQVDSANGNSALIKRAKAEIYEKYYKFISGNTPSQSKTDIDRMFHKVFNVICYNRMLPGSKNKEIDWPELLYNRINWRDQRNNKPKKSKTISRKNGAVDDDIYVKLYYDYQVAKACKNVKKIQGIVSEVKDDLSAGEATEVHHIFPKSQFPKLAAVHENLILITSSQHRQKAHPGSNFALVDTDYQLLCLISKSRSIENYILHIDLGFYSKKSFINVINTGLTKDQIRYNNLSFTDIRKYLIDYYNSYA